MSHALNESNAVVEDDILVYDTSTRFSPDDVVDGALEKNSYWKLAFSPLSTILNAMAKSLDELHRANLMEPNVLDIVDAYKTNGPDHKPDYVLWLLCFSQYVGYYQRVLQKDFKPGVDEDDDEDDDIRARDSEFEKYISDGDPESEVYMQDASKVVNEFVMFPERLNKKYQAEYYKDNIKRAIERIEEIEDIENENGAPGDDALSNSLLVILNEILQKFTLLVKSIIEGAGSEGDEEDEEDEDAVIASIRSDFALIVNLNPDNYLTDVIRINDSGVDEVNEHRSEYDIPVELKKFNYDEGTLIHLDTWVDVFVQWVEVINYFVVNTRISLPRVTRPLY